jgi:hypothetical protein
MTARTAPAALLLIATSIAIAVSLTGCAPGTPSGIPSASESAGGAAPDATASPAATGPKACELVTAAMIQAAYGFDPGTGTAKDGFGGAGSTECDYSGKVIVQVSLQSDLYYPAATYDKSGVPGAEDPDPGAGVDRGYVAPEAVLVVKGQTGVFVTVVQNVGIPANQALAKAIGGAL